MANNEQAERSLIDTIRSGFVTCVSEPGKRDWQYRCYYVRIAFPTPEQAQALHERIVHGEPRPSSVLVSEVAANIALRLEIPSESATLDTIVAAIADELADFKRAIELNVRGKAVVVEPELATLIEEACGTHWHTIIGDVCVGHCLQGRLATALKRQIAAKREARSVLNDPAALHAQILRTWDRERIRSVALHLLGDEAQVTERARYVLARIIDGLPHDRDWLDPALEREAVAIANLDLPSESATILHCPACGSDSELTGAVRIQPGFEPLQCPQCQTTFTLDFIPVEGNDGEERE